MPLTYEQLQQIWLISDTLLYPEAVTLVRTLIEEQESDPLPATQANGLLNIADGPDYTVLSAFIKHQRTRTWSRGKEHIPLFYNELDKTFAEIQKKRLWTEFSLVPEMASSQEKNEVMIVLAREFIQHLVAENGLFEARARDERARKNGKRRDDA